MLASSGYVARVDDDLCLQCEECVEHCQFSAIRMGETAVVDQELCMGCGICVGQCDPGAIRLERMESKGEPLEIETMIAALNLTE